MEVSPAVIISAIMLALAIGGYFHNRFVYQAAIESRLTKIETQVQPFIKALENMAVQILHHPSQQERDDLLDKFKAGTLTPDDARKLKTMLAEVIEDWKSPGGEVTAAMIISASLTARLQQQGKR